MTLNVTVCMTTASHPVNGLGRPLEMVLPANPPTHQRHTKRATLAVWEFPLPLLVPQTGPEEVPTATWCPPVTSGDFFFLFLRLKGPRS